MKGNIRVGNEVVLEIRRLLRATGLRRAAAEHQRRRYPHDRYQSHFETPYDEEASRSACHARACATEADVLPRSLFLEHRTG